MVSSQKSKTCRNQSAPLARVVMLGALLLAACTSPSPAAAPTRTSTSAAAAAGASNRASSVATLKMLMGSAPQSLDPGLDYTTEGAEVNWLVYTGLTTYVHASGNAGTRLIPGLATALPVVSDGGKMYTATLRKGSCSPTASRCCPATSPIRSSGRSGFRGAERQNSSRR